jgi:hypothetical protein
MILLNMRNVVTYFVCLIVLFTLPNARSFGQSSGTGLDEIFQHPPTSAKPWVFWYWMHAAVSKEGITADLEAMAEAGIGGAYLMPIKGPVDPPMTTPPMTPYYEQLTPEWWQMVRHALQEAKRLHLQIAMHVSDGFALAGGPWITPELSMQKIVWTKAYVDGKQPINVTLPQPETKENCYKDIAVFAFPTTIKKEMADMALIPVVTSSMPGEGPQYLAQQQTKQTFKSDSACWIQYKYSKPFTCRSIIIRTSGFNFQSRRLLLKVSNDGKQFRSLGRMQPPRHGWQDNDADVTYAIPAVTARYYRFVYDKEGTEPGSEDLDAAKWKQSLKIAGIELSGEPVIHQYEGKSGAVWRVSKQTTAQQAPDSLCVPLNKIIDISNKMSPDGKLAWDAPDGNWTIIRIGHTSTGHTNYTGGKGKGLECDKFNPEAVKLQFDKWFGETIRVAGPDLTKEVLKIFHVDSWECGSQNWSPVFRAAFKKRRGYDCLPYIITMTGVPVQSAAGSEKFLHDVRQTIMELTKDNFYTVLKNEVHKYGIAFSAESIAPTMTSDGMLHYSETDIPMGEFWLRSPTHDKPNDMLDAISGGHIYGKQIIQAESFTELRMAWDEHPGMLKALADRNYAMGINRLVFHVFTHNPWMDRQPGMTLNGVGLYFQRNQTWWKPGKAWVDYTQRCQALLQQGRPVADVAVFTGEEIPRRAILPDRLVNSLPGIFGASVVQSEKKRLANAGSPLREMPNGVYSSANMADPAAWIDPLHGYAYDSFNPDALQMATVRNGRIELPGGASYKVLVLPAPHPLSPDNKLSPAVAQKIAALEKAGAKIIRAPYAGVSFQSFGLERDVEATDAKGKRAADLAWTHRTGNGFEIYFISNQLNKARSVNISLRVKGLLPEIWDPVIGAQRRAGSFQFVKGRTIVPLSLVPNQSLFIIFRKPGAPYSDEQVKPVVEETLSSSWTVTFDSKVGGPDQPVVFEKLKDWSTDTDNRIRYYSGTATYVSNFTWTKPTNKEEKIWLDVGKVANMACVTVNGIDCGVAWTAPFRVDITHALRNGNNELRIEVTNTWANRLSGDLELPEDKRITWTTAPLWLKGKPLLPAGLLGPVTLIKMYQ